MVKISIVVPAHNEERNLPLLVRNLDELVREKRLDAQIILVDDNSTDSTPGVCDGLTEKYRKVRVIHRRDNPGMGAALKEGTHAADGEIIVWTMADLSDDLNTVPLFIRVIESGADVVFGSRYMAGGNSGDLERTKRALSNGFSMVCSILFSTGVHDLTNAYRAFRKSAFLKLNLDSNDFAISPEFALKAHLAGFRLCETPTVYRQRKEGIPKFKMGKMGIKYLSILLKALRQRYLLF